MELYEALIADREECPSWLVAAPALDASTAKMLLASRTVFYPGAGDDLHPLHVFGETQAAHCFVHADYKNGGRPLRFRGYEQIVEQELRFDTLVAIFEFGKIGRLSKKSELFSSHKQIKNSRSSWVVYKGRGAEGQERPNYLGVLHAHAEAVWLYWNLWTSRKSAPYAVLLQDHGFGCNWARFGGDDAPLYQAAKNAKFPPWLLVARNTTVWPGYEKIGNPVTNASQFGAMHDHERQLYRFCGSDPTKEVEVAV